MSISKFQLTFHKARHLLIEFYPTFVQGHFICTNFFIIIYLLELGLKIDAMKKIYIQEALLDLESSSFQDTLDRITGLRLKESRQHGL